jgi:hypothetical protein
MAIRPCLGDDGLVLAGKYRLYASMHGCEIIDETFELKVTFPSDYPNSEPKAYEIGGKLPRDIDFHINTKDGSLCLGSRLRVISFIRKNPDISSFFEYRISPFLYSIFYKEKYGYAPNGELEHGEDGLIQDYQDIFGLKGKKAIVAVLNILSKRKRVANKLSCPCHCGKRLGRCDFRFKVLEWQSLARRRWFKQHLKEDFKPLEKPKAKKSKRKSKSKIHN